MSGASRVLYASLLVICTGGCGRIAFDAFDAREGDARLPDSTSDATIGDFSSFGSPTVVPGLSVSGSLDNCPDLTADELEIVFKSNRNAPANGELFHATRATRDAPWDPPSIISELSMTTDETQPALCCDDLGLYFGSNRPPSVGAEDVWRTTRASRTSPWDPPVRETALSASGYDGAVALTADGLEAFVDTDATTSARHIYRSTRTSTASPWSTPVLVANINGPVSADIDPYLVDDNTLLFSSYRSGGAGGSDLYIAVRPSRTDPFGAPVPISVANTAVDERDPWLSKDGRTFYFSRGDATSDLDIVVMSR